MTHAFRSARTFQPLHAEDIADAMALREQGHTAFRIWLETGVSEADLYLAEQLGVEAYPLRPQVQPTPEGVSSS